MAADPARYQISDGIVMPGAGLRDELGFWRFTVRGCESQALQELAFDTDQPDAQNQGAAP